MGKLGVKLQNHKKAEHSQSLSGLQRILTYLEFFHSETKEYLTHIGGGLSVTYCVGFFFHTVNYIMVDMVIFDTPYGYLLIYIIIIINNSDQICFSLTKIIVCYNCVNYSIIIIQLIISSGLSIENNRILLKVTDLNNTKLYHMIIEPNLIKYTIHIAKHFSAPRTLLENSKMTQNFPRILQTLQKPYRAPSESLRDLLQYKKAFYSFVLATGSTSLIHHTLSLSNLASSDCSSTSLEHHFDSVSVVTCSLLVNISYLKNPMFNLEDFPWFILSHHFLEYPVGNFWDVGLNYRTSQIELRLKWVVTLLISSSTINLIYCPSFYHPSNMKNSDLHSLAKKNLIYLFLIQFFLKFYLNSKII
ncbi:hypothetical protein VP01_4225g1 [Puccinia sorghi]|uniref:Uncharacterized protein n=1 Tax=Puccinia sorghi TaxID=27349 RepID=A0A0L6UQK1_9BASI|nr:hypothetical protein VP01_4225g1 [Puccinia sorghi]